MLTFYEKKKLFENACAAYFAMGDAKETKKYLKTAEMHNILPELCGYLDAKTEGSQFMEYYQKGGCLA